MGSSTFWLSVCLAILNWLYSTSPHMNTVSDWDQNPIQDIEADSFKKNHQTGVVGGLWVIVVIIHGCVYGHPVKSKTPLTPTCLSHHPNRIRDSVVPSHRCTETFAHLYLTKVPGIHRRKCNFSLWAQDLKDGAGGQ